MPFWKPAVKPRMYFFMQGVKYASAEASQNDNKKRIKGN